MSSPSEFSLAPRPGLFKRSLATLLSLSLALPAFSATPLADKPLASNTSVAGNLALPLSVEFPTAISVAHVSDVYVPADEYLGYFDPNKCYLYRTYTVETATDKDHFYPAAWATGHTCTGANDQMWSGNFLNWATMQTIDPFRSVLTGGYRLVDTPNLTILEKAWGSIDGVDANFPNRVVTDPAIIAGATPFTTSYVSRVKSMGERMAIVPDGASSGLLGTYFNNTTLSGPPVLTRFETVDFNWGTGSPGPGVNVDNFSARWTVTSVAPSTGVYSFQTVSDDGVRLYVNGNLIIDNWTDHAPTTNSSANISFSAGDTIKVTLEYYEAYGGTEMRLRWKPPGSFLYVPYVPSPDALNSGNPPYPQYYIRVKVCDPAILEANCVAYGSNYKPEGLMQRYAQQIRYSVFGYLNDNNLLRDGGVLRAQQKFVGPTYPVPGSGDVVNPAREWDPNTGVFITNPDNITSALGQPISNSGALNYVNKFGEILRGRYKTFDPVGELYYTALRYYKNLGNVPTWSSASGDGNTNRTYADGFPVITDWNDPIQYACQKNFILGIGDVNSHADKNVPGGGSGNSEPSRPPELSTDPVNATAMTNKVGVMQGLGPSLGTVENYNGCCSNNSALMAGLAYHANTQDIRPDNINVKRTIGKQTVQTYWMDVLEYQIYKKNNQYYLAALYGGFTVPDGFDANTNTTPLPESWWVSTSPNASDNVVGTGATQQPRPTNYYTASKPAQVVSGLTAAFADIASKISGYSSSVGTAQPQISNSGNASFASNYAADRWSGDVIASELTFDPDTGALKDPSISWSFANRLGTQAASDSGNGWDTKRRIVTWDPVARTAVPFRIANLNSSQSDALDTGYVASNDRASFLNYLRGDRSQEIGAGSGGTRVYRSRTSLVGDINGSRPTVVAAPSLNYADASNPGYKAFKDTWAGRKRMVYVGANDGMMHAIDGTLDSEPNNTTAGQEVFAYVPSPLYKGPNNTPNVDGLAALGNPSYVTAHRNYVNATPYVQDIDFGKTDGSSGTDWRSLLIGGLGKGGKSYYAIDVTDPSQFSTEAKAKTKVLWEFTDPTMGYTYGDPLLVKTVKYGWVAILASGYNNADGQGYFYIVNPKTGALLRRVGTGVGNLTNDAGLAHPTAYILDRTDGYADAVYAGDLLGNMWRLDLTDPAGNYPNPTLVAQLTDKFGNPQPVTTRPMISIDPKTNLRYILVGTGRLLDLSDTTSTQPQSYYAIKDGNTVKFGKSGDFGVAYPMTRAKMVENTDVTKGVTVPDNKVGWYLDLGIGANGLAKRVVTSSTTFLGTVAFSAFLPNLTDPCQPDGSSEVYGLDFGTGVSKLRSDTGAILSSLAVSGQALDLVFVSRDGELTLLIGNSEGKVTATKPEQSSPILKKLNWREITLTN